MPGPASELSGSPVAIGLYGKMPAHGDFVRRALPGSFVAPWDAWLAAGIAAARDRLGDEFAAAWDSAPAWRFALPAGICGPDAVAGVMLPSADTVGRRFPLTIAALLPRGRAPDETWFAGIEARAREAREGILDADALTRAIAAASDGTPPPALPEDTLLGLFGAPPPELAEPPASAAGDAGTAAAEIPAEAWLDPFSSEEKTEPGPEAMPRDEPVSSGTPSEEAWLTLLGEEGVAETKPAAPGPDDDAPPAEAWLDLLGGEGQGDAAADAPNAPAPDASDDAAERPPAAWLELLGGDHEESDAKEPGQAAPQAADAAAWDALLTPPPDVPAQDDSIAAALFGDAAPPSEGAPPEDAAAQPPSDSPPPPDGEAAPTEDAPFIEPPAAEPAKPGPAETAPMTDRDDASRAGADGSPAAGAGADMPAPPPERPEQGGWWTLGGGRLPAMVWAFPALPPPEAFVLLLETEA